jgi:histidinol-phosphate aminotransferase/imidazoleglycerol-phosphate dehydratase/histidinol-phosphatase
MRLDSPFLPLSNASANLASLPPSLDPLKARLSQVYSVTEHQIMVTRGASHGFELALRRAKSAGYEGVVSEPDPYVQDLLEIYNLELRAAPKSGPIARTTGIYRIENPKKPNGKPWDLIEARTLAVSIFPAILVIDESHFDICENEGLRALLGSETNVIILKSLSYLYGLAGARIGAVLSSAKTIQGLMRFCEPHPLPTPSLEAALSALDPSRIMAVSDRIDRLRAQRDRLKEALPRAIALKGFEINEGPFFLIKPESILSTQTTLKRFGIQCLNHPEGLIISIGLSDYTDRLLAALGVNDKRDLPKRHAETTRDTKETKIHCLINLDQDGPIKIQTGLGFFDHMLEQIARHGGFSLILGLEGDHHIDAHHSIEDAMLCFGQTLKKALGDRLGLARFGFTLPMDETLASVSIDLSGRPYIVFEGQFEQTHIGSFPTQMVAHAFRSLSETLSASIHVKIQGDNDHHKAEAAFKALGRALRMALKQDQDGSMPSTKGMLS